MLSRRKCFWPSQMRNVIGIGAFLLALSSFAVLNSRQSGEISMAKTHTVTEPSTPVTVTTRGSHGSAMAPYSARAIQNRTDPNTEWFEDSLMFGIRKPNKVYMTIGIPSLVRPRKDRYIVRTLNLLIRHSSEAEREKMVVVIFMADFDEKLRDNAALFLYNKYKKFVDSGFIQIIKAPRSFYPSFNDVQRYTPEALIKVKWHSKQNFDFAFMMLYSKSLAEYYLQLEDDVVTVPNYFQSIQNFVSRQKKKWVCLEFSQLGFIAKLFHSYHLEKLSQMLMIFYNEHPNDVTYLTFNQIMFQRNRIIMRPAIFDHTGVHSSLVMRMNSLKDTTFRANPEDIEDNDPDIRGEVKLNSYPPAKLSCTVIQYDEYTPEKFYIGEENTFFAKASRKGDTFTIVFETPQHVSHFSIQTGHHTFPQDYLRHGELRLGKKADISDPKNLGCSEVARSAVFENGRAAILDVSRGLDVVCAQILVTESQAHWLLISNMTLSFH